MEGMRGMHVEANAVHASGVAHLRAKPGPPVVPMPPGIPCAPAPPRPRSPPVEDGAVARAAQHVLVQAALAALALRPQRRELGLQVVHTQHAALVDLPLLRRVQVGGWVGGSEGRVGWCA